MHRFQAGYARLPMPAWSGAKVSFPLHTACRRFQPPPSSVVVILAASDLEASEESLKKFMDPDDFQNLISSSLCTDTSVVKIFMKMCSVVFM